MDDITQPDATTTDAERRGPSRRAVLGAAAWAAPVVVVASATPAFAASGESLNRTTPASPTFSADQNSTSQTLAVTLTGANGPVAGRAIAFSASGSTSTDWLTFTSGASATTDAAGLATVDLVYGTPKPANGSTFTITAIDPSDPSLSVTWTLTYQAVPNAVVVRVGTGSAALSSSSTAVFLEEYASAGTQVASLALPVAASGGNRPLTMSGTSTSEGELTRSADGRFLVLAGYGVAPGTASVAGTTAAAVNRVVGLVSGALASAPVIDTTTALSDFSSGNNPRSATSTDGSALWVAGGAGGVRYATRGASTSTGLTSESNLRHVDTNDGQLYVSSGSGTPRLATVGTGLPTSGTNTVTNLSFDTLPTSPYEYAFLNLSGSGSNADTLYVADNSASIVKYALVGTTWTRRGSVALSGVTGLAAVSTASGVTVYAASPSTLVKFLDTSGYNGTLAATPTTLATAGTNRAFRGVALAVSS